MDHEPVRTSQEAADVRGTKLGQGAKALVCTIKGVNLEQISALKAQSKAKIDEISKIGCEPLSGEIKRTSYLKDGKLYVVAILPSDMKADLEALAQALGGVRTSLASPDETAELTDCVFGSVPPFSFHEKLLLVADPSLFERYDELAFNAGLLERSIVLKTKDYERIVSPKLVKFASEN